MLMVWIMNKDMVLGEINVDPIICRYAIDASFDETVFAIDGFPVVLCGVFYCKAKYRVSRKNGYYCFRS